MKFKIFRDELLEGIKIGGIDIKKMLQKGFEKTTMELDVTRTYPTVSYYLSGNMFYSQQHKAGAFSAPCLKGISEYSDYVFVVIVSENSGCILFYKDKGKTLIEKKEISFKSFYKEFGDFFPKPIRIGNTALEKFSYFSKESNRLYFVLADGSKSNYVYVNNETSISVMKDIDRKIEEFESWGFKIPKTEKEKLKVMFPSLYGEVDFELSQKILPKLADEFAKIDPIFSRFIKNTDVDTRMKHGIEISKNSVRVFDWVDNSSRGYRSKELKFTKEPKTIKELVKLIKNSDLIPFIMSVIRKSDSYAAGFAAHVNATGGHAGNPVWMD